MTEPVIIKRDITFADNGIMIREPETMYARVVEYCSEGKHKEAPAKHAIGNEIWEVALDVMGEDVQSTEYLDGFRMEVRLTPIIKKEEEL